MNARPRAAIVLGAMVAFALVAAGCADPTNSDEYLALQADYDSAQSELSDMHAQMDGVQSDLEDATARADAAEADVAELQGSLEEAQAQARSAEAQLANERSLNARWPDEFVQFYVDFCALGSEDSGYTSTQARAICGCIVAELEHRITLADFMILSIEMVMATEFDPLTGFPVDADPAVVDAMTSAAALCDAGSA